MVVVSRQESMNDRVTGAETQGGGAMGDKRVVLEFTVSDTGIGMNESTVQRLFQPFMQADLSTSRRFGGTG